MNAILRFLTTSVIWVGYAGTVVTSLIMGPRVEGWVIGLIVVVFGLAAAYATRKLWSAEAYGLAPEQASQQAAKAKRSRQDRLARLLDQMDDDEMLELETLLAVRDDELRL